MKLDIQLNNRKVENGKCYYAFKFDQPKQINIQMYNLEIENNDVTISSIRLRKKH